MANDFSNDANCKAVWNLDDGALVTDSKGTNTLTNSGVSANTVDFKEGDASGVFTIAGNDTLAITDANLDAGFPLKSGDTNKKISVSCWVKFDNAPNSSGDYIWSKYSVSAKRSLELGLGNISGTMRFRAVLGYNSGNSFELFADTAVAVVSDRWYHVGFTYQDSDKSWKIRVWDDIAGSVTETTGNTTNNITISTAEWHIGGYETAGRIDMLCDEVVVFDNILSSVDIDNIRQGAYGLPTNPVDVTGTIAAVSTVSGSIGAEIYGTIAAVSTVSGAIIISSQTSTGWPLGRRSDYDPDLVYDEQTRGWYSDTTAIGAERMAQGGGRQQAHLMILSEQGKIYFRSL